MAVVFQNQRNQIYILPSSIEYMSFIHFFELEKFILNKKNKYKVIIIKIKINNKYKCFNLLNDFLFHKVFGEIGCSATG